MMAGGEAGCGVQAGVGRDPDQIWEERTQVVRLSALLGLHHLQATPCHHTNRPDSKRERGLAVHPEGSGTLGARGLQWLHDQARLEQHRDENQGRNHQTVITGSIADSVRPGVAPQLFDLCSS